MAFETLIYNTAIADGMPPILSQLIIAQAKHETGNFTSGLTNDNNLFGYSFVPGAKWQLPTPSTITEGGRLNARYAIKQNSVHEMTDWIKRRQSEGKFPANLSSINTPESYALLLKNSGYYQATWSAYANGIRKWWEQLETTEIAGGGLFIIAALALIFHKQLGL